MNKDKIYYFIGLATKAGKTVTGYDLIHKAIKSNKTNLVIVATDASDNTKKKFEDCCSHNGVRLICFGEKEQIGRFTGKDERASVAICDNNFANGLLQLIDNE